MNATGVTAGPAESNGRLLLSKWRDSLHVICGLTACTPGSAPGPTLGNEYGKTLPFTLPRFLTLHFRVREQQVRLLAKVRSVKTVLSSFLIRSFKILCFFLLTEILASFTNQITCFQPKTFDKNLLSAAISATITYKRQNYVVTDFLNFC